MALVIKDKPLTIARLRASAIYRLGAMPRGARQCPAALEDDIADVELVVLRRLALQDEAIERLQRAVGEVELRQDKVVTLANTLRRAGDAVAWAAEGVTNSGSPPDQGA